MPTACKEAVIYLVSPNASFFVYNALSNCPLMHANHRPSPARDCRFVQTSWPASSVPKNHADVLHCDDRAAYTWPIVTIFFRR